jgi:hypothetical protein
MKTVHPSSNNESNNGSNNDNDSEKSADNQFVYTDDFSNPTDDFSNPREDTGSNDISVPPVYVKYGATGESHQQGFTRMQRDKDASKATQKKLGPGASPSTQVGVGAPPVIPPVIPPNGGPSNGTMMGLFVGLILILRFFGLWPGGGV